MAAERHSRGSHVGLWEGGAPKVRRPAARSSVAVVCHLAITVLQTWPMTRKSGVKAGSRGIPAPGAAVMVTSTHVRAKDDHKRRTKTK
ncbi:hypothetical protein GCM10023176_49360 [Micromonospora coerulea]|uniref:Uncharacterized protein n=1 Tax=Micromonospora coerulea TaxID=47856 RepID=A0ABP8SY43_9ACTN